MKKWHYNIIGISLLLIVLAFTSCKKEGETVQIEIDEFTVDAHKTIGKSMSKQINKMPEAYPILDSVEYKDAYIYLNSLLGSLRLTPIVKYRKDFRWKVTILHDDNIKTAFTLPGGHIYVYTGLLKFLKAEYELMAVLANEIAYADKELAAITLREEYGGVLLGDIILGKEVKELPQMVEDFPNMEFEPTTVFDADEYAIDLICPFDYDINGLQVFIEHAEAAQIEWIQSKKGENLTARLERIGEHSNTCGEGGVINLEQYQRKIKNFLP